MSPIFERVRANAKLNPNKVALCCEEEQITYGKFTELVEQVSYLAEKEGIVAGSKVGIVYPNGIEFVLYMFMAANLGAVIVPLSPFMPEKQIVQMYREIDVDFVVSKRAFTTEFLKTKQVFLFRDWKELKHYVVPERKDFVAADQDFIITATSGSTKSPKPILLKQDVVLLRSLETGKLYGLDAEDVVIASTPLCHSLAERMVILPLVLGGTAVVLSGFDPEKWISVVRKFQVSFAICVSSQISQIADCIIRKKIPMNHKMKAMVSSSDYLDHDTKEKLQTLQSLFGVHLHEIYGTSEIAAVTDIDFTLEHDKIDTVGKAMEGIDIVILDDDRNVVPIGCTGEIACRTSLAFSGYFERPEMTEQAFYNGYFLTGDRGFLDEEQYLHYCGRKSEIIISGGINIYPKDIEEVIEKLDSVKECVAFGMPSEKFGEEVAVVVAVDDPSLEKTIKANIVRKCVEYLSAYQFPRHIFVESSIERTAMHKVSRTFLKNKYGNRREKL